MPTVSICIPTIYTPERTSDLERLMYSLEAQSFKDFEVIIIEGKEYEELKRITVKLRKNFSIKVFEQQAKGLANARNEAWMKSNSDICVFIDDDVVVTKYWLEEIVKVYANDKNAGGVGGPSLIPRNYLSSRDITTFLLDPQSLFEKVIKNCYFQVLLEKQPFAINKFFRSGAYSIGSMTNEIIDEMFHNIEVDFLDACNMSFRREVIEDVGGFDETYTGLGDYQEPDLSFRVRKKGYKLFFTPKGIVHHFPKKIASGAVANKAFERQRNLSRFVRKNIGLSLNFLFYVLFLSAYDVYKAITEKDVKWVLGVSGLTSGLLEQLRR